MTTHNPHIAEDLERLRDEYIPQAFDAKGVVKNTTLAQVVWKINSCLYKGYPRRQGTKDKTSIPVRIEQVIDVGDWDQLVMDTYGRMYSFQQQDGCKERQRVYLTVPEKHPYDFKNDTVPEKVNHHEMGVSFAAWLARDPQQPLDAVDEWDREHGLSLWWKRNFYPSVDMVVNDLYAKGLLPAGNYTIDIDW